MNRKKSSKKRKPKKHSNLGCILTFIVLIPLFYGLLLYIQQTEAERNNNNASQPLAIVGEKDKKTDKDSVTPIRKKTQIPTARELQIPQMITHRKEQIIHHSGYTVSYNEKLRLPNWVAYELTRQETKGDARRTNRFIADPKVKGVIASNTDYTRSGYDKGHMAPAADMKWSTDVMKESFYFSNMCPQHPELNRRRWKDLEEKIRDWAVADSAIIIICGPIVERSPQKIGRNQVTVPQKFFKVILSPFVAKPKAIGFLFNNERSVSPLATYAISVDSIEILTGLDFFSPLPDELETSIEALKNGSEWGI